MPLGNRFCDSFSKERNTTTEVSNDESNGTGLIKL